MNKCAVCSSAGQRFVDDAAAGRSEARVSLDHLREVVPDVVAAALDARAAARKVDSRRGMVSWRSASGAMRAVALAPECAEEVRDGGGGENGDGGGGENGDGGGENGDGGNGGGRGGDDDDDDDARLRAVCEYLLGEAGVHALAQTKLEARGGHARGLVRARHRPARDRATHRCPVEGVFVCLFVCFCSFVCFVRLFVCLFACLVVCLFAC